MKRLSCIFITLLPALASAATFRVAGTDPRPWEKIFGAVQIQRTDKPDADVVVLAGPAANDAEALARDRIVILEGSLPGPQKMGFKIGDANITVRQICDTHAPKMQIIWEDPETVSRIQSLPTEFQAFANERWTGAPVLAGKRTEHGGLLWMATAPGASGFERYPYLLHALSDLGLELPTRANNIWAFFDPPYRVRADVDYLAKRWREAGIGVLHVAAWHNMEPDPTQDEFLKRVIDACHRNAILVYAWLELPHVSEKFWADHPNWREQTAIGQDAQLDWRKLMNLQNQDCRRAVADQVDKLLQRFDWDGVNAAELYFESLEGASNPARFTPMNEDVRRDFKQKKGFDPKLLFETGSAYDAHTHPDRLREFLDYRAQLASHMQAEWLDIIDRDRASKPYLDVVLTHIDDRFEPGIRDALGADVARSLPLIQARKATLLVEDPATLWNLGPERYRKLGDKYRELTPDTRHLAIDINVVERYQDVYPTKKQTGVELFELVHQAASSFGHVALYFENSLEKQDLKILPVSASQATTQQVASDELDVNAPESTRVEWKGSVEIDGHLWPIQNADSVLVPKGEHRLRPGVSQPALELSDFNGEVRSASVSATGIQFAYVAQSRAIALLGSPVSSVEVDGALYASPAAGSPLLLPAGEHVVSLVR